MIFFYHIIEDIYTKRTYKDTEPSVVVLDGFALVSRKLAGSLEKKNLQYYAVIFMQCGNARSWIHGKVGS